MRSIIFVFSLVLVVSLCSFQSAHGQVVINAGSIISANGNISLSCDWINNNVPSKLEKADFTLTGAEQLFRTVAPLSLKSLIVNGAGNKTIDGDITVTDKLSLKDGIVIPVSTGNNKFTFTGTKSVEANPASFVKGKFFSKGSGQRFYPIGNNSGYYPAILTDGNSLIGIEVIEANPLLQLPPDDPDVFACYDQRYWQLSYGEAVASNAKIGLSMNGISSSSGSSNPFGLTVLEGLQPNSAAKDLGHSSSSDFLISSMSISDQNGLYTFGKTKEVTVKIRNVITPNHDLLNDALYIEYIDLYPDNHVILMDRWGTLIKEWSNFANNLAFDFSALSAGHYICMVEYHTTSGAQKLSQMVSILK